jgi:predicted AlkP superfamily pyrophosphatase or phosphodiesterase
MSPMRVLRSTVPLLVLACAAGRQAERPAPVRSEQTVVLVSLDGFRWDYLDRPQAATLQQLAAEGVRAQRMEAVFPTKTFPNHYTQVTGLYPEHHGIVSNTMVDPVLGRFAIGDTVAVRDARWWGGEPLWVTAERQGVRAASFFWPGSEAAIGGRRPSWFMRFDDAVPHATRVRRVLQWLALPRDSAPRFITLYFSGVDGAGHRYGPEAPQTDSAIADVDRAVGALRAGIRALGATDRVNLLVVSDHGMATTGRERMVFLDDYLAPETYRVIDWTPVGMIEPAAGHEEEVHRRLRGASHLQVYWRRDTPPRWHFRDHPRITSIVAVADEGWTITTRARFQSAPPNWGEGGTHGYDNALPSMGALFIGWGPALARGVVVPRVRAVDLYALMTRILGLVPAPNDGSLDSIRVVLRDPR